MIRAVELARVGPSRRPKSRTRNLGRRTGLWSLRASARLRIRDNAFIQIDPSPPLGVCMSWEDFERAFIENFEVVRRPDEAGQLVLKDDIVVHRRDGWHSRTGFSRCRCRR